MKFSRSGTLEKVSTKKFSVNNLAVYEKFLTKIPESLKMAVSGSLATMVSFWFSCERYRQEVLEALCQKGKMRPSSIEASRKLLEPCNLDYNLKMHFSIHFCDIFLQFFKMLNEL